MDKYLSLFSGELDMAFDAEQLFSENKRGHTESEQREPANVKKVLAGKTKIIPDKNFYLKQPSNEPALAARY